MSKLSLKRNGKQLFDVRFEDSLTSGIDKFAETESSYAHILEKKSKSEQLNVNRWR